MCHLSFIMGVVGLVWLWVRSDSLMGTTDTYKAASTQLNSWERSKVRAQASRGEGVLPLHQEENVLRVLRRPGAWGPQERPQLVRGMLRWTQALLPMGSPYLP